MIEDKKTGLKIAENPEEAMWERERKNIELLLKQEKEIIIFHEASLIMCQDKLKLLKGGKQTK